MSSTQSLPAILGAPIPLVLPDGRSFMCKPLSLSVLSQAMERMVDQRLKRQQLPSVTEVLRETRGHDTKSIEAALLTLAQIRDKASHATLDDVLNWMISNVSNMVFAVRESVTTDAKPTDDEVFAALMRDIKEGNTFIDRWMEMSFGENPTVPLPEQSSGE